jgi:hypothetical protein
VNREQSDATRVGRVAIRVGKGEGAGRHVLSVAHGAQVGQWETELSRMGLVESRTQEGELSPA